MTGDRQNPGKDKPAGKKEDQGRRAPQRSPVPRNGQAAGNSVFGLEGLLNLPPLPPQLIADLAAQYDISAHEFAQRMIELVMQVGEGLINHPDLTLILHFVEALFFNPVQQNEQLLPLSTATEDVLRICQLLTPELRRYLERYLHVDGSGGNPATEPSSNSSGGANKRASGAEISSDAAKRLRTFGPGDKVNLYFNSINRDDPLPALNVRPIPGGFSLEFETAPVEPQAPDQVRSNASAPCLLLFSDSTRNQNNSTETLSGENGNEEVDFDEDAADFYEDDEEEF